jgi:hypothetical protein
MDEPAPNVGAWLGPTSYDTITGAKDLPKVAFTPSKKVARAASMLAVAAASDTREALPASTEQPASGVNAPETGG